jgi:quercetin dioxygenase-like cupin family protein
MHINRVFHGADGQTHFEDLDVPMPPVPDGSYLRSVPRQAGEAIFVSQPPGYHNDWHPAPSPRYFVMLSGSAEVEVSDGEKRVINSGDVVLFEDVAGHGHTMRVLGDKPRLAMHISLSD